MQWTMILIWIQTIRDLLLISFLVYIYIITQNLDSVEEDCVAVFHGERLTTSGKRKAIDYETYSEYRPGLLKKSLAHGTECHFGNLKDVY